MKMKLNTVLFVGISIGSIALSGTAFREAPNNFHRLKNPFEKSDLKTLKEGHKLFTANCVSCHGKDAMGSGNVPALAKGSAQSATDGELFWFIGVGSPQNGMPPSSLSAKDRWKVISYIKSLGSSTAAAADYYPQVCLSA
jgi:mono/diheme cytochrome c family protein